MTDMKLQYDDRHGEHRTISFDTIMDFLEEYETNTRGLGLDDVRNTKVRATFFENPLNVKAIDYDHPIHAMCGMYEHCKNMVR